MSSPKSVPISGGHWLKRILFYAAGQFVLALATALAVRSELGVSPVSSVPYTLSNITGIELGTMTIVVFSLYVVVEILILKKEFPPAQLLQVACAFVFGKFVTLNVGWLSGVHPASYGIRLLMILAATALIAIGLKMYMAAEIVPQAADGLVSTIARKKGKKTADVKNVFDLCSVGVSAFLSWIFRGKIEGIREGTLICALGVGRVLALLNKWDNGRLHDYLFAERRRKK